MNVNTAPADVLAALFPELESDLLDTFVATRKKTPVRGPGEQLLSGSDNMLDLLEKQKIEILRVIFIDLKKDTKCDLL